MAGVSVGCGWSSPASSAGKSRGAMPFLSFLDLSGRSANVSPGGTCGDGWVPFCSGDGQDTGLIVTWLRKLGPSETLSERTFEHCVAIARGDRRDNPRHPSQVAEGNPSTFLTDKNSELGRIIAGPDPERRTSKRGMPIGIRKAQRRHIHIHIERKNNQAWKETLKAVLVARRGAAGWAGEKGS